MKLIDRFIKEPDIKYELTKFDTLDKPINEILSIYPKTVETGRDAGKTKYYLKSFVPFSSGKEEVRSMWKAANRLLRRLSGSFGFTS